MRKILSLFVMLLLMTVMAFAQKRTITGKVTEANGDPVPYASVKVKGSKSGVAADQNGNFKLEVDGNPTLVISATGYGTKEVEASGNSIDIQVVKTSNELSTVVVSALGIKRSVKSTPFATQTISNERLSQTREPDFGTALAGKIAGVQVVGQAGAKLNSNAAVRLRGQGTFNAANAIFVVDGTIVENPADINYDDVANVSVLKGQTAAALYGLRAQGGVIMITTKKAKKGAKLSVDVNQANTWDVVAVLPEYQDRYAGGGNNTWNTFTYLPGVHPAEWSALNGKRFHDYTDDGSWGPKIDGSEYIPWYAWYGGHKYAYKTTALNAQPNNVRDFFNTGTNSSTNISLSTGGDKYTIRGGATYLYRTGIIPNSDHQKTTLSAQLSVEPIKNLTLSTDIQYTFEKLKGDFDDGYSNQTTGSFNSWFHRDLDMGIMRELSGLKTSKGTYASWNLGGNPIAANGNSDNLYKGNYWTNHYTWLNAFQNTSNRNRLLGNVMAAYNFGGGFKASLAYRFNKRTTDFEKKMPDIVGKSILQTIDYDVPRGTPPFPRSYSIFNFYKNGETDFLESNLEFIATYNKQIKDFSIDVLVGGNILNVESKDSSRFTSFGLTTPDVYTLENSAGPIYRRGTLLSRYRVLSAFAKATIGYKNFLYLDLSARNDLDSRLSSIGNLNDNGYFYPSAGVSFVFSEFLKNSASALSFGKLRFSWARIGSTGLGPYALNQTYFVSSPPYYNNLPFTAEPNTLVDPNIRPTIQTSYDAGVELKFLRDRLGITVNYFKQLTTDDIVTTSISATSGYTAKTFNVGKGGRDGIEVELSAKLVQTKDFGWDVSFNWAKTNAFIDFVSDIQDFILIGNGDAFGNSFIYHQAGQPWGQLRGNGIKRINGVPVLSPDGTYEMQEDVNFGSILPDYTGGAFTSVTYKNFTLSASLDFSKGGKYFSLSSAWGHYSGLWSATAATNDNGVNVREPLANGGGVHVYGVDDQGKPVDKYVDAYTFFRQNSDKGISETDVYDASFIKMREVSLRYNFNTAKFGNMGKYVKRMSLSVFARNPWNIYLANPNFDPSELAGSFGENGQLPGVRSYGFNLNIGF
jgi:TonB-linked SusC/RagA family outer membrane protein